MVTRPASLPGGLRRGALVRALLAAPAPAALARPGVRHEHRLARIAVAALEGAPPGLEVRRHFAARRAQGEEVVGHAKARRLEEAIRALARALLEARLHRPDLAHRRGELAGDGELLALGVEHLVHRHLERRDGALAALLARLPGGEHL